VDGLETGWTLFRSKVPAWREILPQVVAVTNTVSLAAIAGCFPVDSFLACKSIDVASPQPPTGSGVGRRVSAGERHQGALRKSNDAGRLGSLPALSDIDHDPNVFLKVRHRLPHP
jgi:hypothetical protein